MKKIITLLAIVGLFTISHFAFAETSVSNNEKSNIMLEEGRQFNRVLNYDKATQKFKEAIKLNPKNAEAYFELAKMSSDKKTAIDYYTKAININPNNEVYYMERGLLEYPVFDVAKAMADFNKAIEINPESSEAYAIRAAIKRDFGDYKNAIKDMDLAMKYSKDFNDAIYPARAEAKISIQDYDGAIADYEMAIKYAKEINNTVKYEMYKKRLEMLKQAKKIFK